MIKPQYLRNPDNLAFHPDLDPQQEIFRGIEMLIEATNFLVVMLPSSQTSSPTHHIRLLEEADRLGCEIAGPKRTTRWWFSPGRNGLDVEVISPDGEMTRHPVWVK
jgi:hypothetical protein